MSTAKSRLVQRLRAAPCSDCPGYSLGAALFLHATVNQTAILTGAVGGFFLGLALVVSPTDFIGGT